MTPHILPLLGAGLLFGGEQPGPELAVEAPAPVIAPAAPTTAQATDMRVFWNGNLRFQTADKAFEYRLGGRIHLDSTFISADNDIESAVPDADAERVAFRRARLQFEGVMYKNIAFRTQYDFAANPVGFRDVYVQLRDFVGGTTLWLGQFREPFSLDELTSSNDIMFLERALASQIAPSRRTGIGWSGTGADSKLNWMVGAFHSNSNPNTAAGTGDGAYALTGRVAFAPMLEEDGARALHVGLAVSRRKVDNAAINVTRPEFDSAAPSATPWFGTGAIGAADQTLLGLEWAAVLGRFTGQAEFVQGSFDRTDAADLSPQGFYVQGGWMLFGEGRRYVGGIITRPKPSSPWTGFGSGGKGSLEAALRYSELDLDAPVVADNDVRNVTLGLNWYANEALAVRMNYVHTDVDPLGGDAHALGLRVQLVF
jgi:phosphate-selective porin OprO and OprP